ncbi:MAG TPA: hypothetical protein VKY74_13200 [Chloroflexia bacterium]|nr:hypothetical protein [Chloroflexia bacterium]
MNKATSAGRGLALGILLAAGLAGCAGAPAAPASPAPAAAQGRIFVTNQESNDMTVLDAATNAVLTTVPTGQAPHDVSTAPDGQEVWVAYYQENHVAVFDPATLQPIGQVELGGKSDEFAFAPDGKRLYVTMGQANQVAVIDPAARTLLKVSVGETPHGIAVRPDGQEVYVTNTRANTISILSLAGAPARARTFRVGADPFQVTFDAAGRRAYISEFLGDAVTVVDTAGRKTTGTLRAGKNPAGLRFVPGPAPGAAAQSLLWVPCAASQEVWVLAAAADKLVARVPTGGGPHDVVATPAGKVFVTNTNDNTVTVIDAATRQPLATVSVGRSPYNLTFVAAP